MQFADVQLYHRKLHNTKQDKLTQTRQTAALFQNIFPMDGRLYK